jgi:uncharacterized phiE125 gp8 family phage protein
MTEQMGVPVCTVSPTVLPVTLDEAKFACDIVDDDDANEDITEKLYEAVDMVERDSRRQLMPQTWQVKLERFPCGDIELSKVPVASVTFIKYYVGGVLTLLAASAYQVDLASEPCRIRPVSGQYWPSTDCDRLDAVVIEWVAGYATPAALRAKRASAKSAVLLAVRHLYRGGCLSDNYWSMIQRMRP